MKVGVSILAAVQTLVLVLFLRCSVGGASFHGDARMLISLKSGVVDGSSSLDTWRESANYSGAQHCSWVGVQCDRLNRVVALDISNMNLSGIIAPAIGRLQSLVNLTVAANNFWGAIPSEIGNVAGLRSLNISNNFFNGSLPSRLFGLKDLEVLDVYNNNLTGELPVELGEMAMRLRHLDLGGNYFSGWIPREYGKLKKLEYLALSGNGLSGRIPGELGNLERLEQLYLGYYNSFDGGIPSEFGNLTSLVHLDMASCGLEGEIPSELGNLRRLDTIYFQTNALSGPIPPQLGNLASLKSLDLSNNELVGEIPEEFAKLKELRLLNLFMNRLHSGIPSFIGDLPNLEVLQLWKNNFTGGLPRQLGRNGKLIELDVSSNKLTGFIPPDLCVGGKLQILIILDNFFFGPIPESLGTCNSLARVRMGQNYLNGSIPPGLLYLPALAMIELQYNYLSGSIPEANYIDTVPSKLGQMSLSYNRLGGSLPPSIGKFSALQILLINGNDFTGSIPPEIGRLGSISKIDFSRNRFSAQIPSEISRCRLLTYIDLSQNELSGPIPVEITKMPILNYLNVSRNRLNESIPREFENMQSLTAVDFSFNNLSGIVPDSGQFSYFNATSFAGNPRLCGPYVISCRNMSGVQGNNYSIGGPVSSPLKMVLAIGLVFCSLIFAIVAIIKARNLKKASSANSWKLTAFQKLHFASEDILECLKEDNIIGKGGAGIVYRGLMPNGEEVAVKRLIGIGRAGTSSHDHGFSAEIQTLGRIRHRNIVRLLAFCSNHDTNLLVYEYMPNGSLGELLHGNKGGHLHWNTRFKIAIEAAKGLCYLHHDCSPLIVHRDVKSNNILLDSNFEAHVADFGLAKFLQDSGSSECMSSIAGSYGYIAPEYAYTLKVDEKSDVYSFGVVLLELITGKRPVGDFGDGVDVVQWVKKMTSGSKEAVTKILDRRLAKVPLEEAMHIFTLALLCVSEHSVERPTMREVVQMFADTPKSKPTQYYFSPSAQAKPVESKKPLSVPPPDLLCI